METAIEAVEESQLNEVALSVIIAASVRAMSHPNINRWNVYEWAKQKIDKLNPTADEHERAMALLTRALNI